MITLKLIHKHHIAGNVWAFVFEPSQPLTWTAGQFIKLELPHDHSDTDGGKRWFTISSAPHEQIIQISTRLTTSSFKQALAGLPLGSRLNLLDEPAGDFTWRTHSEPLVFVAQGIGITPFYSMLRDRAHHGLPLSTDLLYANQPGNPIPFEEEIAQWATKNLGLRLITQTTPFTAAQIAAHIPDIARRIVYVSSPKSMIALLGPPYNLPAKQLKQDFFPGYATANY